MGRVRGWELEQEAAIPADDIKADSVNLGIGSQFIPFAHPQPLPLPHFLPAPCLQPNLHGISFLQGSIYQEAVW